VLTGHFAVNGLSGLFAYVDLLDKVRFPRDRDAWMVSIAAGIYLAVIESVRIMAYIITTLVVTVAVGWRVYCRFQPSSSAEEPVAVLQLQQWRRRIDGAEQHSYKCRCRTCQQKAKLRRAS